MSTNFPLDEDDFDINIEQDDSYDATVTDADKNQQDTQDQIREDIADEQAEEIEKSLEDIED